jgi:hypothetical protein
VLDKWHQKEAAVKHYLFQTLPKMLKLKIAPHTASSAWAFLCTTFNNLGALTQADILIREN